MAFAQAAAPSTPGVAPTFVATGAVALPYGLALTGPKNLVSGLPLLGANGRFFTLETATPLQFLPGDAGKIIIVTPRGEAGNFTINLTSPGSMVGNTYRVYVGATISAEAEITGSIPNAFNGIINVGGTLVPVIGSSSITIVADVGTAGTVLDFVSDGETWWVTGACPLVDGIDLA